MRSIQKFWLSKGGEEGAVQSESILSHLKTLWQCNNICDLRPDAISYNLAIEGWAKSGAPDSAKRMWKIYEDMIRDEVKPIQCTMGHLILHLVKTKQHAMVERADTLLKYME